MNKNILLYITLVFLSIPALSNAATPSPAGAKESILSPADGATVSSPVTVKFGMEGMEIVPAGTDKPNTGHHHLLIDAELPPMNAAIPKDATHMHFGKGQTEASITLAPGKHTLQLLLGDKDHMPHNPPVYSQKITITVK